MDEVVDGVDDGQAGPHVGLEEVLHATLTGYLLQFAVVVVGRRGGNLVGGHHGDIVQEQFLVDGGHIGTGCAIHEDGVEDVHGDDAVAQDLRIAGLPLLLQLLAEIGQVDALATEERMRGIGNAHHVELEPVLLHQLLPLAVNLLDEAAAHGTNAADEEVEHLVFGEEERIVDDVERLAQRLAVHHERDVGLARALCAGNDVDAVASQRAEQLAGNARRVLHVFAHDGDGGQVLLGQDGRNLAHLNLLGKLRSQYLTGQVGIGIAHTDRCGIL